MAKPMEWEQLPEESDRAYAAFLRYRDLPRGERSVRAAIGGTKVRRRTWEGWAADFRWRARVAAYESYLERSATQIKIDTIRQMNELHIGSAKAMQRVGLKALNKLEKNIDRGKLPPGSVIVKLLAQGQTLERLAHGEPTDIIGESHRTFLQFMVDLRRGRGVPDPERRPPFDGLEITDAEIEDEGEAAESGS